MAIAMPTSPALKRIVDALGLSRCRSLSLSAHVDSVVTVTAEQYVTESQLDALATELETRDYVLVPKDEIARLRLTDAEREAVEWYAAYGAGEHAATLRGLLERLGGGR